MNGLRVRRDRGNLSVTFQLTAFVTDWETARRIFVAVIAEHFRESLNPRPDDFSASSATELGEAWCKYRIGGANYIVLRADSLKLYFVNIVNAADDQIVLEVVRETMGRLLPALQSYTRQSYAIVLNHHVDVLDGRVDEYLAHHGSDRIGHAASKKLTTTEYRPVIGFTLRTKDGYRVFRRAIEQSEGLQNGLFIGDHTFVSVPTLTKFDEELSWIEQTTEFADQAVGIAYDQG